MTDLRTKCQPIVSAAATSAQDSQGSHSFKFTIQLILVVSEPPKKLQLASATLEVARRCD